MQKRTLVRTTATSFSRLKKLNMKQASSHCDIRGKMNCTTRKPTIMWRDDDNNNSLRLFFYFILTAPIWCSTVYRSRTAYSSRMLASTNGHIWTHTPSKILCAFAVYYLLSSCVSRNLFIHCKVLLRVTAKLNFQAVPYRFIPVCSTPTRWEYGEKHTIKVDWQRKNGK